MMNDKRSSSLPSPSEEGRSSSLPSPLGRGAGGEGYKSNPPKSSLPPDILRKARKLRQEQTDAEDLLWGLLRNRRFDGRKFRRQYPLGRYIIDFYCHEKKLAVELDGGQHNMDELRSYDDKRTSYLNKKGVRVVRFWNNDVLQKTESVLERLWREIYTPHPNPSPGGRGAKG